MEKTMLSAEEIVKLYQQHELGYDNAMALLKSLGYAEVRADNMLFKRTKEVK